MPKHFHFEAQYILMFYREYAESLLSVLINYLENSALYSSAIFFFWNKLSLGNLGCLSTHDSPASASQILGLKACTTIPRLLITFLLMQYCLINKIQWFVTINIYSLFIDLRVDHGSSGLTRLVVPSHSGMSYSFDGW
jgi:hypothetical protein